MVEVEIKLSVPSAARERVLRTLRRAAVHRIRLRAAYFDTADRALAAQHVALRLRQEGAAWVQTAKAQGDDPTVRLEHNVVLGRASRAGGWPTVDPERHRGTPVGQRLAKALAASLAPHPLQARYHTDIVRLKRERRRPGARLELALDEGRIGTDTPAGGAQAPGAEALCELEIESLSGSPLAVFDEAQQWIEDHGLWLDARSKALRGERLARGAAPPHPAGALKLDAGATLAQAWVALHRAGVGSVLDNASDLAAGVHSVEHVHQLRVGLNRVRTVWRLFEGTGWTPPVELASAVQQVFRVLGQHRDRSIWAAWRKRMRQALGADLVHAIPPVRATRDDLVALLRRPDVNLAWLQWLRLCASTQTPRDLQAPSFEGTGTGSTRGRTAPFERHALRQLRRWHRRALASIADFEAADDARRHRLRKRLKHMRFVLETLAPALPAKPLKRHLRALRRAEGLLGNLNDLTVCVSLLRDAQQRHTVPPEAMAWLLDQRRRLLRRCARALRDYASTDDAVLRAR